MISVVIPLFNKVHTIIDTVQSVLDQTYRDFEVIIINDGSTDNGVQLIQDNFTDSRIRVISQQNKGVSSARNQGILESNNEWVSFLDGDDLWLPDYLNKVVDAISQFPEAGMVLTSRFYQDNKTKTRKDETPEKYRNITKITNFFENPHVFAHISATTINRQLLIENYDSWGAFVVGQKYNEDFLFTFRVALNTVMVFCGYPLAIYNGNVDGQTTSTLKSDERFKDIMLFHNLVIEEWLRTEKNNRLFKIFIKYEIRHIIYGYLKTKNNKSIQQFIDHLNKKYSEHIFSKIELNFYKLKNFNKFQRFYIIFTKLRWRMNGYPRVK